MTWDQCKYSVVYKEKRKMEYYARHKLKHIAFFYDTSFFSEASIEDIEMFVSNSIVDKIIIEEIYREILDGYKNTNKIELHYICDNNLLKNDFKRISFANTTKTDENINLFDNKIINIKSSPILCSSYYRWLPSALEPFFLLNRSRHLYNNLQLYSKDDSENHELNKIMGQMTLNEINNTLDGKYFNFSKLIKSRRKKRREYKLKNVNLNDYKLCLGSFLYTCATRISSSIITCDYDLVDIVENIYRSIVDQFAIRNIIHSNLYKGPSFNICTKELKLELDRILKIIHSNTRKEKNVVVNLVYYDKEKMRCFPSTYIMPEELIEFFLLDKSSVDCYSISLSDENYTEFRYKVDPTKKPRSIHFEIAPKIIPFYKSIMPNCYTRCRYCQEEKNPVNITTFFKTDVSSDE